MKSLPALITQTVLFLEDIVDYQPALSASSIPRRAMGVGRLIMLKECLAFIDVVPFIILMI